MARVFYAYCTKPDAPERIRSFHTELGWEPVFVITCAARNDPIAKLYPDIPVVSSEEFSATVAPNMGGAPSSESLLADLQYFAPFTQTALSMMDRFAHPDSFTLHERIRYLRKLVNEWGSIIDGLLPDVVHFDETPHGVIYFVIYHLCRRRGIPTVWFVPTGFVGYNFLGDTIGGRPLGLPEEGWPPARLPSEDELQPLLDRVDSLRYQEFSHWYMDQQAAFTADYEESAGKVVTTTATASTLQRLVRVRLWPHYAREIAKMIRKRLVKPPSQYELWREQPNEDMAFFFFPPTLGKTATNGQYADALAYRERYKNEMAEIYRTLASTTEPLDRPYVYFPLHFQPERTTNPEGGLLEDQFVAIATVHDALPLGWLLYVKEHPTQFNQNPYFDSEKGRFVSDYEDLLQLKNLRLIDLGVASSDLVRNSKATVTITGTAAWEAAVNGVPGLHMAHTWYEGFPGTRFVQSFSELQEFFRDIDCYEKTSPEQERTYLRAFLASTFTYDVSEQDLPEMTFTAEQQASGAIAAMRWWETAAR